MGVVQYKIWHDIWHNKSRTLQVVMIIAMGAFAVGMIIGGSALIRQSLSQVWLDSAPSTINLAVEPAVDDETLDALAGLRGVEDVDGYATTNIEWRLSPTDEWSPAGLIARDDYEDQTYAKVSLVDGAWPTKKSFAVEQGSDAYFNVTAGQQIYVRIDDREYQVQIDGVVFNPLANPPAFGGNLQLYTTRDYFGDLTGDRDFNRILAGMPTYDEATATDLANRLEDRLEKLDFEAFGLDFPPRVTSPEKHAFQDIMDGLFFLMGIMAVLTLILGLLLVYNTIKALVTQQVNQIGVMKAVGGRVNQILRVYLVTVLIYGLLALLIAIPLGALGGYGLASFLLGAFNIQNVPFSISMMAVSVQIGICLLAPLITSLVPIFTGARITVREAISTYGLNTDSGPLSRWLAKLQHVSRLILLMLNNTFRNRGRVILTQMTLVGSGLIFVMVMSVRDSTIYTFEEALFDILRYNVSLTFKDPERIHEVENLAIAHPEVKAVEMWALGQATLRPAGQPETNDDETALLFGVPLPTELYGPQLRGGRWLEPWDSYAIILNQELAADIGAEVGDQIILNQNLYGDSRWTVVGLMFDPVVPNNAYVPRETLLRESNSVGKASTIWIQTVQDDGPSEVLAASHLRAYFDEYQLDLDPQGVFPRDTATELATQIRANFGVIITLLASVAVIMGVVGAFALSGMLSLSVLERTREIGVMRATGATSWTIAILFIGEGLTLGWLSWLIAIPLSIPAGYLMTQALGTVVQAEIIYAYTPYGALIWLAMITVLSVAASWLPARGATRISVRESLAYQ